VRTEAKGHGTRRLIEGNFVPGSSVVIVEDVITSGSSALQAIQAVRGEGGQIAGVLAVVDREQGGRQALESAGYSVRSLTTSSAMGLGKT
jgi:orotate phosphoribosyltransferase